MSHIALDFAKPSEWFDRAGTCPTSTLALLEQLESNLRPFESPGDIAHVEQLILRKYKAERLQKKYKDRIITDRRMTAREIHARYGSEARPKNFAFVKNMERATAVKIPAYFQKRLKQAVVGNHRRSAFALRFYASQFPEIGPVYKVEAVKQNILGHVQAAAGEVAYAFRMEVDLEIRELHLVNATRHLEAFEADTRIDEVRVAEIVARDILAQFAEARKPVGNRDIAHSVPDRETVEARMEAVINRIREANMPKKPSP